LVSASVQAVQQQHVVDSRLKPSKAQSSCCVFDLFVCCSLQLRAARSQAARERLAQRAAPQYLVVSARCCCICALRKLADILTSVASYV
jgi:hypothetical protein